MWTGLESSDDDDDDDERDRGAAGGAVASAPPVKAAKKRPARPGVQCQEVMSHEGGCYGCSLPAGHSISLSCAPRQRSVPERFVSPSDMRLTPSQLEKQRKRKVSHAAGGGKRKALPSCPTVVVGQRIEVWWKEERQWYAGRVAEESQTPDGKSQQHLVTYDDGDEQWHHLGVGDDDPNTPWGWKFRPCEQPATQTAPSSTTSAPTPA